MKVKLVFYDWLTASLRVPLAIERLNLETGVFHSGSTFQAEIELDSEQEKELNMALRHGFRPIFWLKEEPDI